MEPINHFKFTLDTLAAMDTSRAASINTLVRDLSPVSASSSSSHPTTHLDIRLASTPPSHSPLMHPIMSQTHVPPLQDPSQPNVAYTYHNFPVGMVPMDQQTYSLYNQQMWMMQQQNQYSMGVAQQQGMAQGGINPNAGVPMGMSSNLVPNMYYNTGGQEMYQTSNYAASTSAQSAGDDVQYQSSSSAKSNKPKKPKRNVRKAKASSADDSESDFIPELEDSPSRMGPRPRRSTQKKTPTPPSRDSETPEATETVETVKVEEDAYTEAAEEDEKTPMASCSESEAATPKPKRVRKKKPSKATLKSSSATAQPLPGKPHLTPNGVLKVKVGNTSLYVCDVCQKTFKQNGHMRRHKRLHGGEESKVHGCPIEGCTSKYYRRDHLRRHFDSHWNTFVKANNGQPPKLIENAPIQSYSDDEENE